MSPSVVMAKYLKVKLLNMKIAVYGSATGDLSDEVRKKARELGRQIAKSGHTVVTGACPGLPQEAVIGAYAEGGECIAFHLQ